MFCRAFFIRRTRPDPHNLGKHMTKKGVPKKVSKKNPMDRQQRPKKMKKKGMLRQAEPDSDEPGCSTWSQAAPSILLYMLRGQSKAWMPRKRIEWSCIKKERLIQSLNVPKFALSVWLCQRLSSSWFNYCSSNNIIVIGKIGKVGLVGIVGTPMGVNPPGYLMVP